MNTPIELMLIRHISACDSWNDWTQHNYLQQQPSLHMFTPSYAREAFHRILATVHEGSEDILSNTAARFRQSDLLCLTSITVKHNLILSFSQHHCDLFQVSTIGRTQKYRVEIGTLT